MFLVNETITTAQNELQRYVNNIILKGEQCGRNVYHRDAIGTVRLKMKVSKIDC